MSVDKLLERLVTASERQAAALEGMFQLQAANMTVASSDIVEVAEQIGEEKTPTYAEKRKAEVAAEKAAAEKAAAEKAAAEKKPRGRPPKKVEEKPAATEAAPVEDPPKNVN
jgi:colicin import membrane protein